MQQELRIDGVIVDLSEGFVPFSTVYQVGDSGRVLAAAAKRSVALPSTSTNRQIFENWPNSALTSSNSEFKPFEYKVGGSTVFRGRCQLVSASTSSNGYGFETRQYKVDLYGNNADWFLQLAGLKMSDLDYTDLTLDESTVGNAWSVNSFDDGQEVSFCLVKWREWRTTGEVDYDELTGFIWIKSLVNKIFNRIGYSVQSDFFASGNFKRLIHLLPPVDRYPDAFSQDRINVQVEGSNPITFGAALINQRFDFSNQPQVPPFSNPFDLGTDLYTVPYSGYYEFTGIFSIITTSVDYALAVFVINTTTNQTLLTIPNGSVLGLTGNQTFSTSSDVFQLNAGDQIEARVIAYGSLGDTVNLNLRLYARGEAYYRKDGVFAPKYLIGDGSVTAFLRGLQHIFNLRFEAEPLAQTVRIEPADTYRYQQARGAIVDELRGGFYSAEQDRTDDLDTTEGEVYSRLDRDGIVELSYISDDENTEELEMGEGLGFLSARFDFGEEKFSQQTEQGENPYFAKTLCTVDNSIALDGFTAPQIPLIYPQNYVELPDAGEADYSVQPRILYFGGTELLRDGAVNWGFAAPSDAYPFAFMVNYRDSRDFSLSFADEQVDGFEVEGLLRAFYLTDYARQQRAVSPEFALFWSRLDILNLSFRKKIKLLGQRYILQKLDGYRPLDSQPTKTVLLLDVVPEQSDSDRIESTTLTSLIQPL